MDITIFLASLWGPTLLVIGIGFLVSPKYYLRIYRDIEQQSFAMLFFALTAIPAAIAQITFHNVWGNFTEILISFLGWATLAKATVYAIKPDIADKGGDWVAASKLLTPIGVLMIIGGGYLTWIAFF